MNAAAIAGHTSGEAIMFAWTANWSPRDIARVVDAHRTGQRGDRTSVVDDAHLA